jgi:FAD:protein FMN transferase
VNDAEPLIRRARPLLGTLVEITVSETGRGAIDDAFEAIAHVHKSMSFHEPGSDLSRLNSAPVGKPVEVRSDLIEVLRIAATLYRTTGGLFDVTRARELVRDGFLPMPKGTLVEECDGSANDIDFIDDTHVRCNRRVAIDLGGIAKGFAVDRAVDALRAAGVPWGIVNAGGDLRVFGALEQVVHVRTSRDGSMASLALYDAALASSANTATRRIIDGRAVTPHIGRNGQPVMIDDTISVVAATCVIADAMTKVAMADPDLAAALLAEHHGSVIRVPAEPEAV